MGAVLSARFAGGLAVGLVLGGLGGYLLREDATIEGRPAAPPEPRTAAVHEPVRTTRALARAEEALAAAQGELVAAQEQLRAERGRSATLAARLGSLEAAEGDLQYLARLDDRKAADILERTRDAIGHLRRMELQEHWSELLGTAERYEQGNLAQWHFEALYCCLRKQRGPDALRELYARIQTTFDRVSAAYERDGRRSSKGEDTPEYRAAAAEAATELRRARQEMFAHVRPLLTEEEASLVADREVGGFGFEPAIYWLRREWKLELPTIEPDPELAPFVQSEFGMVYGCLQRERRPDEMAALYRAFESGARPWLLAYKRDEEHAADKHARAYEHVKPLLTAEEWRLLRRKTGLDELSE